MARKSSGKTPPKKRKIFAVTIKWLFVAGLWAGIIGFGMVLWYGGELPEIAKKASFEQKSSITILAADGSVLTRYGDIRGESVSIGDIPPHLVEAILAIEDRRFYQHFGIDPLGLARALAVNITSGRTVQGGSTITQQLAKNLFLSQERTLKRKAQEAMLALWLENALTKDEILSAYMNRVYLGSGAYGVDAASKLYFKKPVRDISVREAATLAGLLKAPSRYSPLQNPKLSEERANVVLNAMADAGYMTEAEAEAIINTKTSVTPVAFVQANSKRYFTDWILEELDDLIGTPTENIIIETTLLPHIQNAAQTALSAVITEQGETKKFSQGAVIVLDPAGAVLGMVGGTDYTKSQFNRAVQARRQPGSAFKPIVYLAALEKGWTSEDLILDAPITEGKYRPQNFDGQYLGGVTLGTALANSINTVAVRLMQDIGPSSVIATAQKLGITTPLNRDLSLALGTSEVSALELVNAYAIIANGGYGVRPFGITKIVNDNGDLYYDRPRRRHVERVIEPETDKTITKMLEGVIDGGTGIGARLPYAAAGKTGTTQDNRDAWFIGFTDELVAGVWLGNDDNSPMDNVAGGNLPAQIWKKVMLESRGKAARYSVDDFSPSLFGDLLSRMTSGSSSTRMQKTEPKYNE